jgi:hypothetical protein
MLVTLAVGMLSASLYAGVDANQEAYSNLCVSLPQKPASTNTTTPIDLSTLEGRFVVVYTDTGYDPANITPVDTSAACTASLWSCSTATGTFTQVTSFAPAIVATNAVGSSSNNTAGYRYTVAIDKDATYRWLRMKFINTGTAGVHYVSGMVVGGQKYRPQGSTGF